MRTLQIYLLREMAGPFALGMVVFPFICVVRLLFRLIDLVLNNGADLWLVCEMLGVSVVGQIWLSVPMAVLLAVVMASGRLSADREILALRACGVNLFRLFLPVLTGSVVIGALLVWANQGLLPRMNLLSTDLALQIQFEMLSQPPPNQPLELSARGKPFGVLLCDWREPGSGLMHGVVVQLNSVRRQADEADLELDAPTGPPKAATSAKIVHDLPTLIIAQHGRVVADRASHRIDLQLTSGSIQMAHGQNYLVVRFEQMERSFPALFARTVTGKFLKAPLEMSMAELAEEIHNPANTYVPKRWTALSQVREEMAKARKNGRFEVEYYLRWFVPLACVAFTCIAIPLGIQLKPSRKTSAFAITLMVLFFYYGIVNCGVWLGITRVCGAALVIGSPNVVLSVLGLVFLYRKANG